MMPFPPIALVNRVSFTDPAFDNDLAGCAFLARHGGKLFACTCKHALWVAKSSAMKGVHFEGTLKAWRMDRKDDPKQWVKLGRLLNEDRNEAIGPPNVNADWLVFEVLENHSDVKPLELRERPLVQGEILTTLGWTFQDKEGPQRAYRARFHRRLGTKLLMEDLDPPSNKAGTSGAPVVDAEGCLVGITSDFTKDPETGQFYASPCSVDVLRQALAKLKHAG